MDTRQADDSRIGDARSVFPCEQAACEDIGALMVSTPVCTETVDSSVMMGPCVQAALGAHRSPDENQVDHPEQRQLSRAVSTSRDINTSVEPIPLESSSAQPRSRSQKSDYKVLPAPSLVEVALGSIDNLDFPRVTEICERLEMEPGELDETVHILVATLGGKQDAHLRMKLRALTISNELMYSTHAVEAFRKVHGLQEALQGLRGVHDTELGEVTDQNVRMLATEIDRVCFGQSSSCVTTIPTSTSSNELLGWQGGSLESNLERLAHARQKARDAFAIAGRKAEQTMLKAERAVDRTAKLVFQEAERTWEGLVGDDSSSVPRKKDKGKESLQQRRKRVAMEDHQLQWALNASLEEEATRQRQQVTAEQQPQHQQQGQQRFQRQQQELHQQQQHQQQYGQQQYAALAAATQQMQQHTQQTQQQQQQQMQQYEQQMQQYGQQQQQYGQQQYAALAAATQQMQQAYAAQQQAAAAYGQAYGCGGQGQSFGALPGGQSFAVPAGVSPPGGGFPGGQYGGSAAAPAGGCGSAAACGYGGYPAAANPYAAMYGYAGAYPGYPGYPGYPMAMPSAYGMPGQQTHGSSHHGHSHTTTQGAKLRANSRGRKNPCC
mmetsp:Transcript_60176/g.152584  ORF Transcript_60176/g.152584 Transcript_60176/m.152584 type:complete len:607 (-) Transcript_60176:153-1973(-)